MKHHKLVSKQPQLSTSNFAILKTFMIELTDRVIELIFEKTR